MKSAAQTLGISTEQLSEFTEIFARGIAGALSPTQINKDSVAVETVVEDLTEPIDRLNNATNKYSTQMYDVDTAVRVFILKAPAEVQYDSGRRPQVCAVFAQVLSIAQSGRDMADSLRGLMESLDHLEMPRKLWPVVQKLKLISVIMIESMSVTDEWIGAIHGSSVRCPSISYLESARPGSYYGSAGY
jgi:hypothetical protein